MDAAYAETFPPCCRRRAAPRSAIRAQRMPANAQGATRVSEKQNSSRARPFGGARIWPERIQVNYARDRRKGEPLGDFTIRAAYVGEVREGRRFND